MTRRVESTCQPGKPYMGRGGRWVIFCSKHREYVYGKTETAVAQQFAAHRRRAAK